MSVPFSLAPMATLTHRAFRELVEDFGGCDFYFAEMIGVEPFLNGGRFEAYYADPLPRPDLLVYQLVGGDSDKLAKVAGILDARETAGIDLNMGCAAPDIVRTGGGVRWMARPEEARVLAAKVRKAVKGRLSVKLRLGAEENFDLLVAFCRMLQDEGVQGLTLHPRTAGEKLRRTARWDYVGKLRAELFIPVAGNGDVDSAERLSRRAGGPCDGVMVGRAAVRLPWIFAQARKMENGMANPKLPPQIDLEALAFRFLDLLARHQPVEFHETRARRFFHYYCDNLTWAHHIRTLINRESELGAMGEVLRRHFTENPGERWISTVA